MKLEPEQARRSEPAGRSEPARRKETARRQSHGRKQEPAPRQERARAPQPVRKDEAVKRQDVARRKEAARKQPLPPRPPARKQKPPPRRTGESRGTRVSTLVGVVGKMLWFLALGAGVVGVVLPWVGDAPDYVPFVGAVTVTTLFTHGLAVRTGGRPLMSGGLALALSAAAAISQQPVLLAGAAVATAVVTGILAVLATTPAARFVGVIREVTLAALVGVVGAFAVSAWGAEVSLDRIGYLAIGFSLLGALALVYRLGAGLHGLGRRGFVMIISGVALLTVTLAYTAALTQWGSPALISSIDSTFDTVRDLLGAVPRPIEVLLGFPALAWGVSTRARRRQGWWVCAFGAPGLAVVALSLLSPETTLAEAGLSVLYSLTLGLLVGYAVIRADLYLTGARGRRARRLEELAAHRPEPGRLMPLL